MVRTRLRNNFLKNPVVPNKLGYTKQKNFCLSLLRKVKRKYFANLNEKNKSREKITLVKNEEVISDDVEVANTLNNYFANVVKI